MVSVVISLLQAVTEPLVVPLIAATGGATMVTVIWSVFEQLLPSVPVTV